MLGGAGLRGPEIRIVGLPTADGVAASPDAAAELIAAGVDPADRLVLAVGSHEPRKNHLALLQAAELAWRDGARFTLVIVGGNSWDAGGFHRALDAARARGRRVITLSSAPDTLVWALYGRAEFTVFPSLNEGFGLPVAESISRGVPVITSDFGSMRELAEGRGGLLVDPRDDAALAAGIRTLLDDPERLDALRAETHSAPRRGWAEYAAELWNAVEGQTA
nr:glycosyltransferase [Galbitalea soli]